MASLDDELRWCGHLRDRLPPSVSLRLDANGGLTLELAQQWLNYCDMLGSRPGSPAIEFLEQPLPPTQFEGMQQLAQQFHTPIALDESVATVEQLEAACQRGWAGIVVVKPAIAGSPTRLVQVCQTFSLDVVVSSVLETSVGTDAALAVATQLGRQRAVGFGVQHYFPPAPPQWPESLWLSPPS